MSRVKFNDLYDMYPNKWVVTINEEWKDGGIDNCEVYGVYNTENEVYEAINGIGDCGMFKMVKPEDDLGFIFIITS